MDYKSSLLVLYGASHKTASEKQKLENVRVVMLKKGSDKIFWKTKHSQEQFHEAYFLQKNQIFRK